MAKCGISSCCPAFGPRRTRPRPQTSPQVRKLNTYGPVPDFTTADVTCGSGENIPTNVLAPVKADETVIFDWGTSSSDHNGLVVTYITSCGSAGCADFKGDSSAGWVKIDQDVFYPDRVINGGSEPWGEQILHLTPSYYRVTIPAGLANGEYLLRHEILGLHVASTYMGAQFYPNCVQVQVTNGGSVALPTGIPLPGSYNPNDTSSILVQLWQIQATPSQLFYIAPGGPVVLPGGTGDWGKATYGGDPQPPLAGSTSTTTVSSASTTVKSTSTSSSSSSTKSTTLSSTSTKTTTSTAPTTSGASLYGQCGGIGWNGPTTCASGTCTASGQYYSQCLPN